ncbi:MAG: GNAT family N-acetyltransferase, partial [Actinobacteria bacterium]|nr:GNAT family N-acetyltransferase [Actinomycetota bacterium]
FFVDSIAFGYTPNRDVQNHPMDEVYLNDYAWCVLDGDDLVGATAAYPMEVTVPGGASLGCPGVTSVAVKPTHRRRGSLRMLMTEQLLGFREAGMPLAGLNASESTIYGRYGYGHTTALRLVSIDTQRVAWREGTPYIGDVATVSPAQAASVFPDLHERQRAATSGMMSHPQSIWSIHFEDPESARKGASQLFHVVHRDTSGTPDGAVSYRIAENWGPDGPRNELKLMYLIGIDDHVVLALWKFLLSIDLVVKVTAERPLAEPLTEALLEPRCVSTVGVTDFNWLRILDPITVFAAREYLIDGRFVVGFDDSTFDDLAGNYAIDALGGTAEVSRTDRTADLTCSAADWGSIFAGSVTAATIATVGRARGDASRATEFFRCTQVPFSDTHY